MKPCQSPFPPGLVIIVSADLARFTQFNQCLLNLLVPEGTEWSWAAGTSIESNRNVALSHMKKEAQWVYTIDDDHSFKPDTLMRLLNRMYSIDEIDILQGLCMTRKAPFQPYAYMRDPDFHEWGTRYISAHWSDIPITGVSEWDACGTGGMLIRRRVIDAMAFPWFEAGKTAKDHIGEDLYFCTKAKELGYRVWVDSDVRTGHMTIHTNWPVVIEGQWHLGIEGDNQFKAAVPQQAWAHCKYDEIEVQTKK